MSFVLKTVRPDKLQNWIRVNAPGSLKSTAGDSWRAFLAANGGTGKTFHDLEQSYLTAQLIGAGTLHDRWNAKVAATSGKSCTEKLRTFFQ
jgi:hypothetical protein